jgi:hypothetical protein
MTAFSCENRCWEIHLDHPKSRQRLRVSRVRLFHDVGVAIKTLILKGGGGIERCRQKS